MDEISDSIDAPRRPLRGRLELAVVAVAALIAAVSARDYAGGWNDGSRLATVESLVDRHALSIDESLFVRSPATAAAPNPYAPGDELLRTRGTKDKLFIAGHYYSDKSPLPAFGLAGCYQLLKWSTGLTVREHPRLFCYLMTLLSSGVAYVVSIWAIWRLAWRKGLPWLHGLLLAASLALATLALPYVRHVNNHILLLATLALLILVLDRLASDARCASKFVSATAGLLSGLGYTLDLGVGPVLLLCTAALIAYRTRSIVAVGCFGLAALPCLAAHHAVNYATGGTVGPANSVAEYLAWPGSPFSTANMTGGWAHGTAGHFVLYSAALLLGKHGFLNYNLPLLLAAVGLVVLLRRRMPERPEVVFAAALAGGAWLLYAALSNNYAGPCCSVRWFVPLLAPGYYVLVLLLRQRPALARDLAWLSLFGAVLCAWLWWRGPWDGRVPLVLWPLDAAAVLGWSMSARRARPQNPTLRTCSNLPSNA
ncbi:MAG TPA: hypothetical protein VNH11_23520 [Pirellulales bacterium]|nr:hypothetical protein [Pirellulales bacterium]